MDRSKNVMITYLTIGLVWCFWLETYTTKNNAHTTWVWRERIFHTFLWPVSLSVFLITLFNNFK